MYCVGVFVLGAAIAMLIVESLHDFKSKKVGRLLSPKAEMLLEISSMKISKRQKELERELTEFEKDIIYDECYKEV